MFGYIRPQVSELLVREYEQYKGVYCSLCKELGKSYGIFTRFTLSYDSTFLSLFILGRGEECVSFQKGRCVFNPLKRCAYCGQRHPGLKFSSALSVLMTYYKIRDDIEDSGFFGRMRAYLLLPLVSHPRKKAARDFPELEQILQETIGNQKEQEQQESPSLDACAEPTAQLLSRTFGLLAGEEEFTRRVLETFGYFLGRWVYLIDAADDMEKDLQKKEFNPFLTKLQLTEDATPEQWQEAKTYCNEVLNLTLSQAIGAIHLIDFPHFGPIILNIILQGLPEMQKKLLFEKEKHDVRSV